MIALRLFKKENKINVKSIGVLMIKHCTLVVLILMLIIAAFASDSFFTARNITNLLRQISSLGVVSIGMLFVIITGGIDLSVGSLLALASVLMATFITRYNMSFTVSLVLSICILALMGFISGFFIANMKIAPFVMTLAMMTIARGAALMIANGSPIMLNKTPQFDAFGNGYILGIPFPVILMLLIVIIAWFVLNKTVLGRMAIALGSNETAVVLAGIKTKKFKIAVYTIAGAMCAIAGFIDTSRTSVGSPIIGTGFELQAIAAVVIGGASLAGGKGSVLNTLFGVIILGIISNIMNIVGVPGYEQQVVEGVIIVLAVLLQGVQSKIENE